MAMGEIGCRRLNRTIFACVFVVMLAFNFLTPLLCDDFAYAFSFSDWERIDSAADIFPSMQMHRIYANGRVVAHFLAQLFIMLPKAVFNFFNAGCTVLILYLMLQLCPETKMQRQSVLLLLAIAMIWYFTPDFGQVYLWLDGSCNYSWALCAALMFLLPYYQAYRGRDVFAASPAKKIGFLILALLAGAYSESGSCAMLFLGGCFVLLYHRKYQRVPTILITGMGLAVIGFLYMMSAPVETGDRSASSAGMILYNINYIMMSIKHYQLGIYCIFAVLLTLSVLCGGDREKILLAVLFALGGLVSLFVFALAKYCPARAMCPVTAYLTLGCMILCSALLDCGEKKLVAILTAGMAMLFAVEFMLGAYDIAVVYGQAQEKEAMIRQAKYNGETQVTLKRYHADTKYSAASGLEDLNEYPGYYVNTQMAKYYELDYIFGE